MLIDAQCHIFPIEYARLLAKHSTFPIVKMIEEENMATCYYDEGLKLRLNFNLYSMEGFLKNMEENEIDFSIISCNIPDPCTSLPAELVAGACIDINNEIDRWVKAHPDKFRGIASIPWNLPEEAIKEIRRTKEMGFCGVQLLTQNGGVLSDDPMLEPLYAECEKLGITVFIHPTAPAWHEATNAYNLTATVGFPIDTSLTALRMINGRVFDRYPALKVHMPHAGGVLPWLDGRLSYSSPAVPKPKFGDGKTLVDILKGENFWYDLCNPSSMILSMFKTYMGCERAMLATDYPFLRAKEVLEFLENAGYTEEELELVKWKNANKLYDLGL